MSQTPFVSRAVTILAAATLLTLPAVARAQFGSGLAGAAQADPHAAQTPRQVEVTVDWVDIPETDVSVTNVGLGPNIDSRLMAALIQNGAIDTKGPRLRVTEGQFGSLHVRTDVPTAAAVDGNMQKTVLHLDNFIEATPQVNLDGSITVTGGVQRQTLFPHVDPAAAWTQFLPFTVTVTDGQPCLLNRAPGGFGDSGPKQYVFLRVTTVKDKHDRSVPPGVAH